MFELKEQQDKIYLSYLNKRKSILKKATKFGLRSEFIKLWKEGREIYPQTKPIFSKFKTSHVSKSFTSFLEKEINKLILAKEVN
jgi:hypothetical protein